MEGGVARPHGGRARCPNTPRNPRWRSICLALKQVGWIIQNFVPAATISSHGPANPSEFSNCASSAAISAHAAARP